jgi:hypothetical protein
MIYQDEHGFLVNERLDGMDSCFRAGITATFSDEVNFMLFDDDIQLYVKDGICVRHPLQVPANNPKNFSKDQLIPLMSGLYKTRHVEINRKIFWKMLRRGFFAQNFERDLPGTTKYPWPHKMKNGDPVDNGKWRMFDFADPLFWPHYMYFFAKVCRYRTLELLFKVPGELTLLLICFASRYESRENETNQLLCMLKTLGHPWPDIYNRLNPMWFENVKNYWHKRNEHEYADRIGAFFL